MRLFIDHVDLPLPWLVGIPGKDEPALVHLAVVLPHPGIRAQVNKLSLTKR